MTLRNFLPIIISGILLSSCADNGASNEETTTQKGIELADVGGSPEFPGATITVGEVTAEPQGEDSAKVSFNFDVKNYELMNQTADAEGKQFRQRTTYPFHT